jgi:hypothetical protein
MTTVETTRPKVLRKLVIDEFSFVDRPASVGSDVLVWKRDGGAAASADGLRERLAKAEADLASLRANDRVDEVYAALAKRDVARATELLRDSETYDAYRVRLAGERYAAPVAVAKAGPDHRAEIRKAVADDDGAELERLVNLRRRRCSTTSCCAPGELETAVQQGVAKRARTPARRARGRGGPVARAHPGPAEGQGPEGHGGGAARGRGGFEAAWVAMVTPARG